MPITLLASDATWIRDEIDAALASSDTSVSRVRSGAEVLDAVRELQPDLVVLDLQIQSMGGVAVCYQLRLEEGAGRIDPVRILLLLDRADDAFLARRAGADGWLVKPLDALRIQRAAAALLSGESYAEEPARST